MADKLTTEAELQVSIEGIIDLVAQLDRAKQSGKKFKEVEDIVDAIGKAAGTAASKVGKLADGLKGAGDSASKAAKGWKAYADALTEANKAHRKGELKDLKAEFSPKDIPKKQAKDLTTEERRAVIAIDDARNSNFIRETRRIEKLEQQKISSARRVANAEAAAYMKATDESGRAGISGRALSVGAPRTGAQSNLRAAGVADFDRQLAAAESAIGAVSQAEASLPRLRYALYDVATTAGIVSTAITGIGVASVAAFASMESSFTNVERTLDNVSGGQVQALRKELVGLSHDIPQTFANISEIATLGNQLGIQAGDIAKFTEVTAKFSAVTGLTAEASAQAFGSLGQLLHVQSRDYEALGSSIALVGRKSVATEQEIVSMTTRLAASATNAGFTAQQVIALSGAFASLRIAPERAQGVMEIYFKRLNTAISEGGPRLEAFGKIAGVTSAEVENLVRTDPVAFFEKLATGLGQMDQIAQTGALAQLGLDGIRAGEVFGRVSANVGVFNKALTDANQGWLEGTELGDQYAKVVDDLASRWQIFLNAIQEAGAAVGAVLAPALGLLLSNLTDILQSFAAFASTPFGGFATGVVVAIGAIVAGITGLVAVGALGVASMVALKTAMIELTAASGASVLSFRTLSAGISSVGTAAGFSTGAVRIFKGALLSTGIGALVVILGTVVAGIMDAGAAAQGFSAEAKSLGDSLNRAIDADTEAYFKGTGDAIATATRKLEDNAPAADKAAEAAQSYAGVQSDTAGGVDAATKKIQEQTIALGENADALYRKKISEDAGFSDIANSSELRAAAEQAGFTVDQMISEALSRAGGATAYVEKLRQQAQAAHDAANTAIGEGGIQDAETQKAIAYAQALQTIADKLSPVASQLDEGRAAALAQGAAMEYAGVTNDAAASAMYDAGDASTSAAGGMYDVQSAAIAAQNELFNLGQTLGEGAYQWDVYSEAGRANLGSLYAWMTTVAGQTGATTSGTAANFAAMYQALIDGGVATANQLLFLRDAAASLAGTKFENIKPAAVDFSNLFNGINSGARKAAKAIGGGGGGGGSRGSVAKAVRTLIDYANDLSGVFKRAFDIRFGGQSALDGVTSGWRKVAEDTANAAEEMAKYRATLAELGADKQIKQYWLSVAENYGDQLRAAKLRAELADLDNKQADAQKDLSKAQDKTNKTLAGNSDAAIDNRKTILDMVGSYQDLLKTYAANGMSQADLKRKAAQLKAEFIAQATQAGFSRAEITKYASSFDDMAVAINRVPRNITVSFNPNPALQALAEFEAKAKAAAGSAGRAAGGAFGGGFRDAAKTSAPVPTFPNKAVMYDLGYKNGRAVRAGMLNGIGIIKIGNRELTPGGVDARYGYASGGYTGNIPANRVAGAVHGQEYVMSAPAVRTLGVNGMNFMHNMLKSGRIPTMGAGGGGGGVVDLSANSARMLAGLLAANLQVVLPGARLAGSVGAHNVSTTSRGAA